MAGFTGKRLMKHQSEDIGISDRLISVFVFNWRIKFISLLIAISIVWLKANGIVGNGWRFHTDGLAAWRRCYLDQFDPRSIDRHSHRDNKVRRLRRMRHGLLAVRTRFYQYWITSTGFSVIHVIIVSNFWLIWQKNRDNRDIEPFSPGAPGKKPLRGI